LKFPAKPSGESFRRNLPAKASGETFRRKLPAKASGESFRRNLPAKASGESFGTAGKDPFYPAENPAVTKKPIFLI
jgi:ribosomal protein L35AE/L33A